MNALVALSISGCVSGWRRRRLLVGVERVLDFVLLGVVFSGSNVLIIILARKRRERERERERKEKTRTRWTRRSPPASPFSRSSRVRRAERSSSCLRSMGERLEGTAEPAAEALLSLNAQLFRCAHRRLLDAGRRRMRESLLSLDFKKRLSYSLRGFSPVHHISRTF